MAMVVVAIVGGISTLLLVLGLVWLFCRREKYSRMREDKAMSVNRKMEMVTAARKFSYRELRFATSNFADEGLLGEGGLGKVYLGFLSNINCSIAVKRKTPNSHQVFKFLSPQMSWARQLPRHKSGQASNSLQSERVESEVTTSGRLRHRNLVQLIGWCHENKEFLPNKSLDYHLHREPCLYKIAMGVASALFYLQEECDQCVLHRDIKSSNVLLDLSFNAKLSDLGLARVVDHGQGSQTTKVMLGTGGYIAPECLDTYKAIKESNVYNFGIVALEIASEKKAIALIERNGQRFKTKLVEWVWELYGKESLFDAADPRLSGNYDMEQMERLLLVGLACAHPNYFDRPSITQADDIISFKAALSMEAKHPYFGPIFLPEPFHISGGLSGRATQPIDRSSLYSVLLISSY
ncbi:hypothetical protein ES288_D04G192000v1 [Gossypium darwinii]|uniref:Protein kinase domain-containing protein n=1 Tax=Gossypium darwinii TaxID=34276 RepID=A0A5D2CY35_GOSDA|nr:hypothetical protein ES288_D04G192000v1 [Gossypium darwinii]